MTSEQSIHERVWALYQAYRSPDAVMFHVASEGIRGPRERATFKAMGGVAGVPDFFCAARQRSFFLELKKPGGRLSVAQKDMIGALGHQGVPTLIAYGLEEAVRFLQRQGVLRADVKFSVSGGPERFVGAQGGAEASASAPTDKITHNETEAAA